MDVLIPCCGKSTRFPGVKPKFLLTDYDHKIMLERTIEPFLGKHKIHVVILKEHNEKYNIIGMMKSLGYHDINFIILDNQTAGPADTVYRALTSGGISWTDPLLIKDCDSFFDIPDHNQTNTDNVIYTHKLSKLINARKPGSKSYVVSNDQDIITNIVEKEIISDNFCVGGYQIGLPVFFVTAFENFTSPGEVFVSDVINAMMEDTTFIRKDVMNYIDVGTLEDWTDYNDRPTIFCDIDGTLVLSQSRFGETGFTLYDQYQAIPGNVATLLQHKLNGCQIIFTTARSTRYEGKTRMMLDELGFDDCQLIMGLHHSRRIIINDFNDLNRYPTAVAVNIEKNTDMLNQLLPAKKIS